MTTTTAATVGHLRGAAVPATLAGRGAVTFVAGTEGRKSDGLDVQMSTLRLARYRANPVVGYGHSYVGRENLPIGRASSVRVERDRLLADVEFDQGDPFAVEVERKVRAGFLNAVSIGFNAGRIDDAGRPEWVELYEISVVPIPMDADALVAAGRADAVALRRDLSSALAAIDADPGVAGLARAIEVLRGRDRVPAAAGRRILDDLDHRIAGHGALNALRRRP